jgi:hypothetical protein
MMLSSAAFAQAPAPKAAADISGKWTATFDTQVGEQKYTYDFQVKGTQLTGTAVSNFGKAELRNGKVEGDTVTFLELLDFQGMPLEIAYTGKIVSADQIDFERKIADVGTEKLVAKRVK